MVDSEIFKDYMFLTADRVIFVRAGVEGSVFKTENKHV